LPALASAGAAVAALLLAAAPAPHVVLTLQDPSLNESSGLTVSKLHPHLLWTHNDGGTVAQVVGVDARGDSVAHVTLAGIDPYDPEALAPGVDADGRPALFLGDIGDNDGERPDVSVFEFAEPATLGNSSVVPRWYRFTYPDGPHDAEALLVDPHGRIMIASKEIFGAVLYRAPAHLVTKDEGTNRLTRVATVPGLVTDGAYLPDGRFVLRTYSSVFVYDRPGHEVAQADLPPQPQGESVAADGNQLLIGSEGVHTRVIAVPVPVAAGPAASGSPSGSLSASPSPSASTSGSTEGAVTRSGVGPSSWVLPVAGGAALFAVLAAVTAARRRRRH
jgi:hypothetical protein